MEFTITLSEEDAEALRDFAIVHGKTPEEYARLIIEQRLAPEWLRDIWKRSVQQGVDQISMEEINAEIAAARRERRERRAALEAAPRTAA